MGMMSNVHGILTALANGEEVSDTDRQVALSYLSDNGGEDGRQRRLIETLARIENEHAGFMPQVRDGQVPTITVAGIRVAAYIDPRDGVFRVGVDLDDVSQWLTRDDEHDTVPLVITVQGNVVFVG